MRKLINPMSDYGFKRLFGRPATAAVTISFLNGLFQDEPDFDPIVSVEFKDKDMTKTARRERGVVYDIYCTTNKKHHFIVEMQCRPQGYFIDRTLFYASRMIVEQGESGAAWKYEYKPVYTVSLLDYTMDSLGDSLRTDAMVCNMNTHKPLTDKMRFTYIQLPLFDKTHWQECENDLELWLYTIKNAENMDRLPYAKPGTAFAVFEDAASYGGMTPEERHEYELSLQAFRDQQNMVDFAEARGIEIGEARGAEAERRKTVLKLNNMGMDNETIAEAVGISVTDVHNILQL